MAASAGQEAESSKAALSGLLETIGRGNGFPNYSNNNGGMITRKINKNGIVSSNGYCGVPRCNKRSDSLSVANSLDLTFFGFHDRLAVVKICPECSKKAAVFQQMSVESIRHGISVFEVEREPVRNMPEMVDLEPTTDAERPVAPARKEMLAVDFNRSGVESIVKSILNKYNVLDVQLKRCKQQTIYETVALGKGMDQLETKMQQLDDKLYETYKKYNQHVDTRPQSIVTQEWEINADGTVRKRNLGGDDDVFVNSDSLNRLSTLIENSSTAAVPTHEGEEPPTANADPRLDDSIVSLPDATPRKAGPASKTGYYEALDAQRSGPFQQKTPRPLELRVKTQVTLLPTPDRIPRVKPKKGDIIYGMHKNLITCWLQCEILDVIHNEATNATEFVVNFEPHRNGNPTGGQTGDGVKRVIRQLCLRQMAYNLPCPFMLPVGSRVIARYKEEGKKETDNDGLFYAGVIAEPAKKLTNNRYLVFFDDGYAQYVFPDDVLLVCEGSKNVWNDVYPDSYDFIRSYVIKWPNWPMVKLAVGNRVSTEWNGKWMIAVVQELDNHLAKVKFETDGRLEWIYRGSARFRPIHKIQQLEEARLLDSNHKENKIPRHDPVMNALAIEYKSDPLNPNRLKLALKSTSARRNYHRELEIFSSSNLTSNHINMLDPDLCVEFQGSLTILKIPDDVKSKDFVPHECNPSCAVQYERRKEMRQLSPLAIPFHFGWTREVTKSPRLQIFYRSPCGLRLRDIDEVAKYLSTVESDFSIDQFCFDYAVDCLSEFIPARALVNISDISYGKENVNVHCINSVDYDTLPYMDYIPNRIIGAGVNLNTEKEFLTCCDCTDNCEDKDKCACWKMTHEGISFTKMNDPDNPLQGYEHRRLKENVVSGIYECNSNCKCKSTCSNRVVQNGVQWPLQIFKTTKKGWGIRAVYDMPEGTFICIYSGQVLTEQSANEDGIEFGDEYLAELDYIECNEAVKADYESDVTDIEAEDEMNSDEEEAQRDIAADSDSDDGKAGDPSFSTRAKTSEEDDGVKKRKFATRRTTGQKKRLDIVNNDDDMITARDAQSRSEPGRNRKRRRERRKPTRELYGENETCYIMDAKSKGNIGRYLNHSCSPNTFVQNVFVDTHDMRFPLVAFFTNSLVKAGTELTWDYHYQIGSVPDKVLYCFCMTPYCRGRLL